MIKIIFKESDVRKYIADGVRPTDEEFKTLQDMFVNSSGMTFSEFIKQVLMCHTESVVNEGSGYVFDIVNSMLLSYTESMLKDSIISTVVPIVESYFYEDSDIEVTPALEEDVDHYVDLVVNMADAVVGKICSLLSSTVRELVKDDVPDMKMSFHKGYQWLAIGLLSNQDNHEANNL